MKNFHLNKIFSLFLAFFMFIDTMSVQVLASFGYSSSFGAPSPSSDWDNDELTYFQETELFNNGYGVRPYDPFCIDTNKNGISDGNEDYDNDGLPNLIEFNMFGTNPTLSDTDGNGNFDSYEDFDGDGYSNYAELYVFFTDSLDFYSKPASGSFPGSGGGGGGSTMGTTDRDGDGLSYIYEQLFGYTDNNVDSDGNGVLDSEEDFDNDGLTNIFEINTYSTDPTLFDTDFDSLSDGDEIKIFITNPNSIDTDKDNLEDGEEVKGYAIIVNGTSVLCSSNPYIPDTDNDGYTDKEEKDGIGIEKYKTNPSKFDTDDDGISDSGEIQIGLNPLNFDTDGNGISDDSETFEYLKEDFSNLLSDVNNLNSDFFEISIEANVAGFVDDSFFASKSVYSEVIKNDALVGGIIDYFYDENLSVDSVNISYKIQSDNSEYEGSADLDVSRLRFFKYFSSEQILLPVKTEVSSIDTITTVADNFGTYCVIDLNKIFNVPLNPIGYDYINGTVPKNSIDFYPETPSEALSKATKWSRNGHYYLYIDSIANNRFNTWEEAESYCESIGGHLATIENLAEEFFIEDLYPHNPGDREYWLGLYCRNVFGNSWGWRWVTSKTMMPYSINQTSDKYYTTYTGNDWDLKYTGNLYSFLKFETPDSARWCIGDFNSSGANNCGLIVEFEPYLSMNDWTLRTIPGDLSLFNFDSDFDGDGIHNWEELNHSEALGDVYASYPDGKGFRKFRNLEDYVDILNDKYYSDNNRDYIKSVFNELTAENDNSNIENNESDIHTYIDFLSYINIPTCVEISSPKDNDSDGDGLLDGSAVIFENRKIAPKDPDPLKSNGPTGVWQKYIEEQKLNQIPHNYAGTYDWNEIYEKELVSTTLGSKILNFLLDDKSTTSENAVLHAQVNTWQSIGGYSDHYDAIFRFFAESNMKREKFPFSVGEETFIIWMWKGDYVNLGGGAETGLYCNSHNGLFGVEQWDAVDFTVPMTLNVYDIKYNGDVECIFNWAPTQPQLWITGFKPSFYDPHVMRMVSLGTIDFIGREDMFNALKIETLNRKNQELKDIMIFDEDGHTVWYIW
jgi:hypothetical protein